MTDILNLITEGISPTAEADPFTFDAQPEQYLRPPKAVTVSPAVVAHAQRSYDAKRPFSHVFTEGQEKARDAFLRQVRNAGEFTEPKTRVTARKDPDNPMKVIWRASKPRVRKVDGAA